MPWKVNMPCLKLIRAYSISFNSSVLASISGTEFLKTVSISGDGKETRCLTWPTKHEIRKFSRRRRAATTKKCTISF